MEPVFPLEVVSIILGHCGREEMLRARLVCKDWNDLCLKHLAKSSHTIKLPYKKIKDLVKFLQETGSRPVLPLELTIPLDERNPKEVASMLGTLLDVIDPTCSIILLDISQLHQAEWIDFYPFLEKISPGLRCLSFPRYFFDYLDMGGIAEMITFPKLRILRLPCLEGMMNPIFGFYSSLVSRCPALKVLEVDGSLGTDAGDIELRIPLQLKSLSVNCVENPHILLNQIRTAEVGAKLETIRCNPYNYSSIHPTHRPHLLELLQELAHNLRHFFHLIYSLSDPLISHIPFPMLVRLDIEIEQFSLQEIRSRLNLNLCARMLPALTTLAIPIGRYLVAQSELSAVRHLILKAPAHEMIMQMTPIDYKEFFSHVFGVCPNVERLDMETSIRYPSTWISELLQCSQAVRIEEFGVYNYTRDWIGETPVAAPQPESSRTTRSMAGRQLYQRPALSNVRKLRLSQGKYNGCYTTYHGESHQMVELDFSLGIPRHSNSKKRTRLHLRAIRNHFPNLRSLELSPRMLGSDYDSSWTAVRKIQSIYRDWKVDLVAGDSELFPEVFRGPYDYRYFK